MSMTKEQEKVIERANKLLELKVTPFNNNKSVLISKTDLETVLNMLKENSAEIQQKNTELAEKNAEIENLKADNKKINKILDEINNTNYPIIN